MAASGVRRGLAKASGWARHRATGENYLAALGHLIRRNNRRSGGYIVHLAILLIGAGAVGSQVYQQQTQATLAPGESVRLAGYTITASGRKQLGAEIGEFDRVLLAINRVMKRA